MEGTRGLDSEVSVLIFRELNVVDVLVFMLCLGGTLRRDVAQLKGDVAEELEALLLT